MDIIEWLEAEFKKFEAANVTYDTTVTLAPQRLGDLVVGLQNLKPRLKVSRYRFGTSGPSMALSMPGEKIKLGEQPHAVEVLFACTDAGWHGDADHARDYLVPGHIYTTKTIDVGQSRSRVELVDFPGVWFNTVLFLDWPSQATSAECSS